MHAKPLSLALCAASVATWSATAWAQITLLVSENTASAPANSDSSINSNSATSDFGRWTVFVSASSDLVAGDSNNAWDVFVRDRTTGAVTRVSVSSSGQQANADSGWGGVAGTFLGGAVISPNGRFIAFSSRATNLTPGVSNAWSDVYLHDRDTDADGVFDEPGAISTALISASTSGGDANSNSHSPDIDALGNVVFASDASDLVASDGNSATDVFAWDGTSITRLSRDTSGDDANGASSRPKISKFGGHVAFASDASDLIASDTNRVTDVFVANTAGGGILRLSERPDGTGGNGASAPTSISRLGDLVVFDSAACNLLDASCSGDTNGAQDVYMVDRDGDDDLVFDEPGERSFSRISVTGAGGEANGFSAGGAIAAMGTAVAFRSAATNLTSGGDPDGAIQNIYLRTLSPQGTTHVGVLPSGGRAVAAAGTATEISVSTEGGMIVFGDYGSSPRQVYLRDGQTLDTDGDSLLDTWEVGGIDSNADGVIDLTLPPGTDPWLQTVIVEIDAMAGMLPSARTLTQIQNRFQMQDANQYQLILIVDETNITPQTWSADIAPMTWPPEFTPFKNAWFGTAAQRQSPNWPNIYQAKLWTHRYCVFAQDNFSNTIAGMAETPGNDFFLTLGGVWSFWGASPAVQLGVFLHELGHNLNLQHGGGPGIASMNDRAADNKPNYFSVMNGSWTTPQTGYASSWPGNLSDSVFNAPSSVPPIFIDERLLFELDGVGGFPGLVVPCGPPPMRLVNQDGPVDWNNDGVCCSPFGVAADVNYLNPAIAPPSPAEVLTSHNDYANLQVQIGRTGAFMASAHGTVLPNDEFTYQDFQVLETLGDWRDNLDNYALGAPLYIVGGWETWCDGGDDAIVSSEFFQSPPHSMQIVANSDVVKRFEEDAGRLFLTMSTYVPSSAAGTAYVIGLNEYCADGHNWSMQVEFNADEQIVRDFAGAMAPLAVDRWAELRVEIDLDADLYSIFYDQQPLAEGLVWSEHVSGSLGDPGEPRLRALNFYGETTTGMYLDDLLLERPDRSPPVPCRADWDGNGAVNAADVGAFITQYFKDLTDGGLEADFDGNGVVNAADVGAFLSVYFEEFIDPDCAGG